MQDTKGTGAGECGCWMGEGSKKTKRERRSFEIILTTLWTHTVLDM